MCFPRKKKNDVKKLGKDQDDLKGRDAKEIIKKDDNIFELKPVENEIYDESDSIEISGGKKELDRRGNVREAVQRESSWAVDIAKNMSLQNMNTLYQQAMDMVQKGEYYVNNFHDVLENQGLGAYLGTPVTVRKALDGVNKSTPPAKLCEILLNYDVNYKGLVDLVGLCVGMERNDLRDKGRSKDFFKDRGRENVPDEEQLKRRDSMTNKHGGITETRDRSNSTADIFEEDVTHAKGFLQRDPSSDTAEKFSDSGTPFIGGASGTIQFIAMTMENDGPAEMLKQEDLDERERRIVLSAMTLIAGGHHSLGECLLAAQSYGYFKGIPSPLDGYDACIQQLAERLDKLGIPSGRLLGIK